LVIANDASRTRIQALKLALERWGAINTAVTCQPGDLFGMWFPGVFDKVLIDAPCSMEGLRTAESHPMRPVTERERESLAARQSWLLINAVRAVRPGGQVVYSTCTLAPEEDEQVLQALKHKYGSAVEISIPMLEVSAPPLHLAGDDEYPDLDNALRFWPHLYHTAGFFSALIRKNVPIGEDASLQRPHRTWDKQGWIRVGVRVFTEIRKEIGDQYGFDILPLMERQGLTFWKRAERIFAIPGLFLERFYDFPADSCGMELGSTITGKLMVSHAWASRFAEQFTSGRLVIPSELIPLWLRGSDLMMQPGGGTKHGSLVCLYDDNGQFLGRGKVLSGRIKNLLPRRLVA
jgi:16S rRNA (cytosine1407-C5)-methyltransferase